MQKAVIYVRVSSMSDRQNIQHQIEDLAKLASQHDYEVLKVSEEHISGATKNENRTILMECLNFCLANKVDCLLLSELSHLKKNFV